MIRSQSCETVGPVKYLGTYRFVPPIAVEAWARASVVFGAYLAAAQFGLSLGINPLSFAIALEFGLTVTWNFTRFFPGKRQSFDGASLVGWSTGMLMAVAGVLWLLSIDAAAAMRFWVGWHLALAVYFMLISRWPAEIRNMRQIWFHQDPEAPHAMLFTAAGHVLTSLTALSLMRIDPIAQVAFVTFGAKWMVFLTNWVIVLMLYQRWRDREDS